MRDVSSFFFECNSTAHWPISLTGSQGSATRGRVLPKKHASSGHPSSSHLPQATEHTAQKTVSEAAVLWATASSTPTWFLSFSLDHCWCLISRYGLEKSRQPPSNKTQHSQSDILCVFVCVCTFITHTPQCLQQLFLPLFKDRQVTCWDIWVSSLQTPRWWQD